MSIKSKIKKKVKKVVKSDYFGPVLGGAVGFVASGGNPLGAAAGASLGAGLSGAQAAKKAAKTQAAAGQEAAALQDTSYDKNLQVQQPFYDAGIAGQNKLLEYLGLGGNAGSADYGKYTRDFGMSDFQQDPGYQFRLDEGLKALDRQAAARGGLISGAALKAAGRYGQDYASNEYTNAFNRYQINRNNQLAPLGALAGAGQNSANFIGSAAQNYANNKGDILQGIGNARASGYVGASNALMNGLGQAVNLYSQNSLLQGFGGGGGGGLGGPAPSIGSYNGTLGSY